MSRKTRLTKKLAAEISALFSALGRKGARKRAQKLSPGRRREIARKAANARWRRKR